MLNFYLKLCGSALIVLANLNLALSGNILFFHLLATSSHRTSIWPLAEKLADTGHHVTYIFPMETRRESHPKIEELVPSKMIPILNEFVGDFDINLRLNGSLNQWTYQVFKISVNLCEAFYESPEIQQWLYKKGLHYDLLIIDSTMGECSYGLVLKFKAKHIIFSPIGPMPWLWDATGIVAESASIPDRFFLRKPQEMENFMSRLLTTFSVFLWRLGQLDYLRRVGPIIQKHLIISAEEMPDLLDVERNTSLNFINSHFIEDYPMALPPNIQSYSGLWCSKEKLNGRKPLLKDLVNFIGNQSVVYVSLGSAVASSTMPKDLRDQFFEAFEAFPELRFLWRWTDDNNIPKNTPNNVLLRPWFPQKDILADSRTKAFITQAGRPSSQEAICHGIPMIAIPIFADQDPNTIRLEHIGAAIPLDIETITKSVLQSAISTIVYNETYKSTLFRLSSLFRDRPVDPLENALYWTEYVLRHDTTHLKSLGMNQTWNSRRLIDVYLFFGFLILSIFVMMCYLLKLCLSICRRVCLKKKIKNE